VDYLPTTLYAGYGNICINVKNSEIKPKEPTLYLTNETNANTLDLSEYLGVIWPSEYASDSIPVNNPNKFILPHGYDQTKIYPKDKVNKQVLYSASPDRGLHLLEQIWPTIVETHPDAHLIVTYGGEIYTPNTTCGTFSEEEMNELYNTSDIWCYPCTGGELFGMNAIKAQAGGAIPVYFPTMSLAEVVKSGIACTDARDMFNQLNNLLDNEDRKAELRQEMTQLSLPTWETTTDRLLEIIESVV
jgi:glycosyltransferase involved in cell wall biosynthesis